MTVSPSHSPTSTPAIYTSTSPFISSYAKVLGQYATYARNNSCREEKLLQKGDMSSVLTLFSKLAVILYVIIEVEKQLITSQGNNYFMIIPSPDGNDLPHTALNTL